jgi:hypothetical protein
MNSGSTRKTTGIIMAISFTPPALEPPAAGLPDIRVLGAENSARAMPRSIATRRAVDEARQRLQQGAVGYLLARGSSWARGPAGELPHGHSPEQRWLAGPLVEQRTTDSGSPIGGSAEVSERSEWSATTPRTSTRTDPAIGEWIESDVG